MRNRRLALTFALVMAAFISVACGGDEYTARAVSEETDRCATCNMAVADDAHATQIVTKDGRTLLFDDIGCMYAWLAEHGDGDVGAAFVRDYRGLRWVKSEKAYYVYDASFKTPMAYGVLSFADKSDAEAFIAEQGKGVLMTADDLPNHSWAVNRDMDRAHGEGAHGHDAGHRDADGHGGGHDGRDAGHGGDGPGHAADGASHGGDGAGHGGGAMHDQAGGPEGEAAHEGAAGHGGMDAHAAGAESAGAVSAA
jgi:Predicted lipoprotein involved in nitrous oxide reduction